MRLRLDSLGAGGEAVGRGDDGRVVFVDGGVPGDLVDVELTEQKPRFARGRVARVIEAGPDRVTPPCVYADRCGGCPWQMVSYEAQLAAKQAIVARALRGIEVAPIIAAPSTTGYRVRATMYARGGQIGFYARRSHTLVPIDRCLMLVPALDAAMQRAKVGLKLGEEGALRGTIADGVQLSLSSGYGGSIDRDTAHALLGVAKSVIVDGELVGAPLTDDGFVVSAAGFRQANAEQNATLRRLVREALDTDARVLELYAGDGNFTRDLKNVVAIEEDPLAVGRLKQNAPHAQAITARVEREVQRRAGERWDRVLLDPPRAGAKEAMKPIASFAPSRIVYVSCDPATLARDLQMLTGYRVVRATPIDMMPHTDHVEVVVVLDRD